MTPGQRATLFVRAYDRVVVDDETQEHFMKQCSLLIRWFQLVNPNQAAVDVEADVLFFSALLSRLRGPSQFRRRTSPKVEQALKQLYSEGLAAGEVVDVYELLGEERPEISILSDAFLDKIAGSDEYSHVKVDVLKRLLDDEIAIRLKNNHMQAKLFDDALTQVLRRYEMNQLTSAEVIQKLVEIAKKMREARRRHEALGLSVEETAFYDAVAGSSEDTQADPEIAVIARDLVKSIRGDLTVDWADHEATESAIRRKIKHLLRRHHFTPKTNGGGGKPLDRDQVADLVLEQARTLYRRWPEVPSELPL
jgi:type I restriction enzyme, R subunit